MKLLQLVLIIQSKNKKSLIFFLKFLKQLANTKIQNLKYSTYSRVKTTILKSPHIYKKAQEHFEYRQHKRIVILKHSNLFKILFLLKKISNIFFHDLTIKMNFFFSDKIRILTGNHFFFLPNFKKCYSIRKKTLFKFLMLLNLTGTIVIFFKKMFK